MAVSGLDEVPRYLANVAMCTNLKWVQKSGKWKWKTFPPPQKAVACCAPKWQRLIEVVQPEIILLLGKTAMGAFGFTFGKKEDGNHETIFDVAPAGAPLTDTGWATYVVATVHPSGLYGEPEEMARRIRTFSD